MKKQNKHDGPKIAIIGAGFAGLSAAYELANQGFRVTLFEAENYVGGLAGSFETKGEKLDKFYHHWFTNDVHVMALIKELGLDEKVVISETNTGMYFANSIYRLSTPLDLLKFRALPFLDRIRLGLLTLIVRRVKNWKSLENITASDWLTSLGGKKVYEIVWGPLLKGKFGEYADNISAVWFWNKIKLRGGSRGKKGEERLAYFAGSFSTLAEEIANFLMQTGSDIKLSSMICAVEQTKDGRYLLATETDNFKFERVIATTPLPVISSLIKNWAGQSVIKKLNDIEYLANVCIVLQLDRSLSSTYWLNVNDPDFPFVGVIEHTNFQSSENYGNSHVVYLSKYLSHNSHQYKMSNEELLEYSLPYLKRMFPKFEDDWILSFDVWRARWAQPVVGLNYSKAIPDTNLASPNFYICSMAQIYPEDRGTNYAIREGRRVANLVVGDLKKSS